MKLTTRLDRYPAKMVSKLADRLVDRYALGARRILDPFCGSGAILAAAHRRGIPSSGIDINPMAGLLCHVKLNGFDPIRAARLANLWISDARAAAHVAPVEWNAKQYWFTDGTIAKFERLRFASEPLNLTQSDEGMAVLLSYALSIRLCSRADQRSPKPFISKLARESRQGRHFDPYRTLVSLLDQLSTLYGHRTPNLGSQFLLADVSTSYSAIRQLGMNSHILTSPPYINAQDYFRNFKLELYLLEGIVPFRVDNIRDHFIGTERGDLLGGVPKESVKRNLEALPYLGRLQSIDSRLAAVVHRYLHDMSRAFDVAKACLDPDGCFVLVCGDNLIKGSRIRTWRVLQSLLEERGFRLFDRFTDPIGDRLLAPKRCGHKGLIKEEVVSAFRLM